jgi:hypothetical protein
MRTHLINIFENQNHSFKINFSFSFILRNIETGAYRFCYAHNNDFVLREPFLMTCLQDIDRLMEELKALDFLEQVFK